ncbi:hypothetical protein ACLZX5_15150 [Enterococcus faecium]|uniref:hypothetical protein n=1 Tax=Enterococcus faecium TaxID=1352 RepID=UPI001FFCC329|nr:hypothetical protein [Enterococcus faecium]MCC9085686.1 hypothetical protein [Enterococcus faecium]
MKNKFILSLGILTIGISVTGTTIPTFADSTNEPTTVVDNNQELTPLDRNGIAIGNPTNDLTVTENYLIVSPLLARAASKTIRVTGTMIFDKVGWPSRPPQSRNWKEKEMVIGTMENCIYKVINQLETIGLRLIQEP